MKKILFCLGYLIVFTLNIYANNNGDTLNHDLISNSSYEVINDCSEWDEWKVGNVGTGIYFMVCIRPNGNSAFYKFKNTNSSDKRITFELTYNNDSVFRGGTRIRSNSETSGSACYYCAPRNSGLKSWEITDIRDD